MPRFLIGSLAVSVVAALLGACAHEHRSEPAPMAAADYPEEDAKPPAVAPSLGAGTPQPQLVAQLERTERPMTPAAPPRPAPSEGDALDDRTIVQLAEVASAGELAQARLAIKRASDPEVRRLARMIETDHERAQRDATRVRKEEDLPPASSPAATRLQSNADATLADLDGKSGAAFDRAYLDALISQHREVLKLIDDRLLPGAKRQGVRALVSNLRPQLQMHLERAQSLQRKLGE
jgi:putative membrane protein